MQRSVREFVLQRKIQGSLKTVSGYFESNLNFFREIGQQWRNDTVKSIEAFNQTRHSIVFVTEKVVYVFSSTGPKISLTGKSNFSFFRAFVRSKMLFGSFTATCSIKYLGSS